MASKVTTLYEDSAKTNALYPRTKVSAISDNSSNSLEQLLDAKQDNLIAGSGITVSGANISSYTDMDLLWTNASPSSSFNTQTVSLDLSGYHHIVLSIFSSTSNQCIYNTILLKTTSGQRALFGLESNATAGFRRITSISDTGVSFGTAQRGSSTQNGEGIPYQIYGIK